MCVCVCVLVLFFYQETVSSTRADKKLETTKGEEAGVEENETQRAREIFPKDGQLMQVFPVKSAVISQLPAPLFSLPFDKNQEPLPWSTLPVTNGDSACPYVCALHSSKPQCFQKHIATLLDHFKRSRIRLSPSGPHWQSHLDAWSLPKCRRIPTSQVSSICS